MTNQTKEVMKSMLPDLINQTGLKIEIIDIQCREKVSKTFVKSKPIVGIDCYKCD